MTVTASCFTMVALALVWPFSGMAQRSAHGRGPDRTAAPAPPALLGPGILRLDSTQVDLQSTRVWRGLDLGSFVPAVTLHIALWEIDGINDHHALLARASAAAALANRSSRERSDVSDVSAAYRFKFDTEQGELNLGGTRRRFGGEDGTRVGNELYASLQRRVPAPGTELRPLVSVLIARDLDVFDATYVEPRIKLDFGAPPTGNGATSIGGRLEAGVAWSDYARRASADPSLGYHGAGVALWVGKDWSQSFVGPLLIEVGVERWWSRASLERLPWAAIGARLVVR